MDRCLISLCRLARLPVRRHSNDLTRPCLGYRIAATDVCFSNRPVRVKRFQTIHDCGVDVARGLVLLSGRPPVGTAQGVGYQPAHYHRRWRANRFDRDDFPMRCGSPSLRSTSGLKHYFCWPASIAGRAGARPDHSITGQGGENCGWVTFQQCLDTVRGNGGFCEPNTQYQPPPGPHTLTRVQRRYPYYRIFADLRLRTGRRTLYCCAFANGGQIQCAQERPGTES